MVQVLKLTDIVLFSHEKLSGINSGISATSQQLHLCKCLEFKTKI